MANNQQDDQTSSGGGLGGIGDKLSDAAGGSAGGDFQSYISKSRYSVPPYPDRSLTWQSQESRRCNSQSSDRANSLIQKLDKHKRATTQQWIRHIPKRSQSSFGTNT